MRFVPLHMAAMAQADQVGRIVRPARVDVPRYMVVHLLSHQHAVAAEWVGDQVLSPDLAPLVATEVDLSHQLLGEWWPMPEATRHSTLPLQPLSRQPSDARWQHRQPCCP